MRNALVESSVLVMVALLTAGVSSPEVHPVLLDGRITDARTGEPLEDVRIVLEGDEVFTTTNSEGQFRLRSEVEAAGLELTLRHPCYHTVRVEVGRDRPTRRIQLGMPFDHEKYDGVARPLGGCL